MTVERDFEQHDIGEAELLLIEQRDVAADVPLGFQLPRAIPARRGRHADQFGELGVAQTRVLLQLAHDLPILVVQWAISGGHSILGSMFG